MPKALSPAELAREGHKAVAEGEAILRRTEAEFQIDRRPGGEDGPLARAWKRGDLPARRSPMAEPATDVAAMLATVIDAEQRNRRATLALALQRLFEWYQALESSLPDGERTYAGFLRRHLAMPQDRLEKLIGDLEPLIGGLIRKGGLIRCTECRAESVCACGCGVAYLPEGTNLAPPIAPEKLVPTALDRAVAAIREDATAAAQEGRETKSLREIAREIGVSHQTVKRAKTGVAKA